MRQEINETELELVNGGSYHIYNNNNITWDNCPGVYHLACSRYEAQAVMDALIGQFETTKEYDRACYKALKSRGWLE